MTIWTPEAQDAVARLLAAGLTRAAIAARLETTRGSIAGIIHRNRTLLRMRRSSARPRPEKKAVARKPAPPPPAPPRRPPPPPPEPEPIIRATHPAPAMRRVGLLELRRFECRFAVEEDPGVIGGQRFCGAATLDTYCEHHAALAFTGKGKGWS
jgi:hypothetical protein